MRSVLCFVAAAALGLSAPAAQAASFPNVPKMFSTAWTKVSNTVKRPFAGKKTEAAPPAVDTTTKAPTEATTTETPVATPATTAPTTTDATATTPATPQAATGVETLVLYSGAKYSGRRLAVTADAPNLRTENFNNLTRSARIPAGETWEFCSDRAYRGHCQVLTGEVADVKAYQMLDRITSARKLPKAPEA